MIVWQTGHGWNEPVTAALAEGLRAAGQDVRLKPATAYDGRPAPSISYGILYGVDKIYKDCDKAKVPWWNVDNGFFCNAKPNGYYRIGYKHLMPLLDWLPTIDGVAAAKRWDALGLKVAPWQQNRDGYILICPPTPTMARFYNLNRDAWVKKVIAGLPRELQKRVIVRGKGAGGKTTDFFPQTRAVVVFNSNVALEALLAGIPAIATEGVVRAWNRLDPFTDAGRKPEEYESANRHVLFLHVAAYQFTLAEIRAGVPWRLRKWETTAPVPPTQTPVGRPTVAAAPATVTEPVTASLASIPGRVDHLKRVVASLLPQVDRLNVYLNGYQGVPEFLYDPKITVGLGENLGDAGKFHWEGPEAKGYRFTCDDDIVYGPDHVRFMVAAIERYQRRAVVSLHGAVLSWPIVSYYRNRHLYHCAGEVPADTTVHTGGTGVMAWHSSTLAVGPEDFEARNMADIWFAVAARKQGVPIVVPAHGKDRLEVLPCDDTIFARRMNDDGVMTAPLKAWKLWDPVAAPLIEGETRLKLALNGDIFHIQHARAWDRMCQWSRATGEFWEQPLLRAIRARYPRGGGVIMDIGAHVGNHTIYFAALCKPAHVIAVEAAPETYALLKRNIAANGLRGRVTPIRAIAGAPGQRARLTRPDPSNAAMHEARVDPAGEACVTVDALAVGLGAPVTVLKIDAEGFEPNVLAGAVETIKRDAPLLAVEAVDARAMKAQRAVLGPLGYAPTIKYGATPVWFWDQERSD